MPDKQIEVEEIYRDHGHVVLRRARGILGDDAAAQEALQEIFLSLLDRPEQFAGQSSITTFLYSATTHHCLNTLRNQRKRGQLLTREGKQRSAQREATLEEQVLASELLALLSAKLATVAVHYYIDEMSQDEIADILGCSRRMVGKHLTKLKKEIERKAA